MSTIRSLEIISQNAADLLEIIEETKNQVSVGMSLKQVDQLVEGKILTKGGQPAFKKVSGYRWATCLNINEGVVHGIPNNYRLRSGDLLSVDSGLWRKGWFSDMSRSWVVGQTSKEKEAFVLAGREVLTLALDEVKPGQHVGNISHAIGVGLKERGFWPVRSLAGHGIGRKLHQFPPIPCFLKGKTEKTPLLKTGMVLAIEVIYTQNQTELETESDAWTIRTVDGGWGGLEEDMVVVTKTGHQVLTRYNQA